MTNFFVYFVYFGSPVRLPPFVPCATFSVVPLRPSGCGPAASRFPCTDGRTVHLFFSGNDSFAVRRGEIVLRPPTSTAP